MSTDDELPEGAHESFERAVPSSEVVERHWLEVALPAISEEVEDDDGGRRRHFSLERLKVELYELGGFLVPHARAVYRHVTGGLTDDLCAPSSAIIAAADRRVAELTFELRKDLEEAQGRYSDAIDRVRQLEQELERVRGKGGVDGQASGGSEPAGRAPV